MQTLPLRMLSTLARVCAPTMRRGSPCELPEETLDGYQAAFDHGIDFIELDAVWRGNRSYASMQQQIWQMCCYCMRTASRTDWRVV